MTPLGQCFMLDKSLRLTFQSMLAIYKSGFTRVPIFEEDRQVRCSRILPCLQVRLHHGAYL